MNDRQSERVRIREARLNHLTRMLAAFPGAVSHGAGNREATLATYLQQLEDVPPSLLGRAIDALIRTRRRMPPVAEIRFESAVIIRERVRLAQGLEAPRPEFDGFPVDRWIARAEHPVPELPAELDTVGPEEQRRARAQLDALCDRLERRARVRP